MQTRIPLVIITTLVLSVAIAIGVLWKPRKKGFVVTQELFQKYKGTQALEQKMSAMRKANTGYLDSLSALAPTNQNALRSFQYQAEQQRVREEELSEQYTAEIWRRINEGVSIYAKENHYEFIFGASGDGNLMYGDEALDITESILNSLNARYDVK